MQKNNRIPAKWLIPALVVVLAVAAVALLTRGDEPSSGGMLSRPTRPPGVTQTGQSIPPVSGDLQTLPQQSTPQQSAPPGEQTDPADESPGDDPGGDVDDDPVPDDPSPPQPPTPTQPARLPGAEDLRVRQYARFSGQYVEDGRDELVENVAAILVTNNSDQFLDLATLTYDVDGEDAVFVVTGLPSGSSAWVMESKRRVIPDSAVFTYLDCTTAFRDDVTAQTQEVSIYADANMLTAVNNTDETLEDVFVYYKTLHSDGNFFGGITYRVDFGTLEPGGSAQSLAGHYSGDTTRVVRIGWVGQ